MEKEIVLTEKTIPTHISTNSSGNAHVHHFTATHFEETVSYIRKYLPAGWSPTVAIICGSGLGGLGSRISNPVELQYVDIPHFCQTTVQGHSGKLLFGKLNGVECIVMVGRFHFYEGHALYATTYPVRIFSMLGVSSLIVTNAAGSLNHRKCKNGDIMIIKDHVNFPGMAGHNPLVGPNLDLFGPRFPATSDAYDFDLRRIARKSYEDLGYDANTICEGTYIFVAGPSYETPAEARFLQILGADAVGMSTVPEVIVARHCGLKVLGLSLITNKVVMPEDKERMENGDLLEKASHEEVLEMSKQRAQIVQSLVEHIVLSIKNSGK